MPRAAAILLACLLGPGFFASASAQQPVRADIDYRVIKPQPVATAGRIEVVDFFWYGCPHCNNLQPALERWIGRKPADVVIRRIPAILRDSWAPHARIYYTLEALGEAERLHQRVYHGYHVEELHMSKPDVMSAWAARNGIDRDRWEQAYNSPEVQRKVEEAAKLTRAYQISGTPSLVVNGRYLTSGNMAESLNGMVAIVDGLVQKVRSEAGLR
ncbi:MAG: thiol:disulfide interchange protein DsbA/DsbL [Burkholderiales bacterium]|nr:thiol:disulfide interchange protein DsbA/DsbL [Burkholderiales bacterium]